ncbi:hypothetical protein VTN77DRAFT_2424 [Rasamsonia byssochlamydoides]|uniref:uncharacterized protein n=1 Tax=Rasamsonia byssochlamydoides TaxID=89139 RepID=UPI003743C6FC
MRESGKDDFGEHGRAWRGGSHDVHHPKRLEASDEGTALSVEGKRITPEHPLKRNTAPLSLCPRDACLIYDQRASFLHCNDHHRLEEKRQG